jgi:hydroxymethylbilane synthase
VHAPKSLLTIGTRASPMALAQTEVVSGALRAAFPEIEVAKVHGETRGDKDSIGRLGRHGGKGGAFVEDLRSLMNTGNADVIVHCLKDLPGNEEYYESSSKFCIGAFLPREDPHDALVTARDRDVKNVLQCGTIGTNAVRRTAYLRHHYRGVNVVHCRGKVDSRIKALDSAKKQLLPYGGECGPVDALVLAKSGLERLGLNSRIGKVFAIDEMCPAVGQGVVVAECLKTNDLIASYLSMINDRATELCSLAERSMLRVLDGHCNSPVAGHAWIENGRLFLRGVVIALNGRHLIEVQDYTELGGPEELGVRVGRSLKAKGADYIIQESRFTF